MVAAAHRHARRVLRSGDGRHAGCAISRKGGEMIYTDYKRSFTVYDQPKPVGGYRMGSFLIVLTRKPNILHRTMTRLCLGWEWEDAK